MYLPSISLATAFLAAASSAAPLATPVPTTYGFGQNAIVRALPYYDTKPPLWMAKRAAEGDQDDVNIPLFQESTYSSLWPRRNKPDRTAKLDLTSTSSPASSTGILSADSGSPSISSASALISARRSTPKMEELAPPLEHILLKPKEYLQSSSASIPPASALISASPISSTSALDSDGVWTLPYFDTGKRGKLVTDPDGHKRVEWFTSTSSAMDFTSITTTTIATTTANTSSSTSTSTSTLPSISCVDDNAPTHKDDETTRCSEEEEGPYTYEQTMEKIAKFWHEWNQINDENKKGCEEQKERERQELLEKVIPEEEEEKCVGPPVMCDKDNSDIEKNEATEQNEAVENNEATENKEGIEKRRVPILDDIYDAMHPPCVMGSHCEDWDKYDEWGVKCEEKGALCWS